MTIQTLPVHIYSSGVREHTVMLGEKLVKQWAIPTDQTVQLAFGSCRQEVVVASVPKSSGIHLSQPLAARMGLVSPAALRMNYQKKNNTLRLGPLISVLVTRENVERPDRPFGPITLFCQELVEACQKQGAYAYFFTTDHIKENAESIYGWIYDRGWRKAWMPVADIVNNRLTSRILENKPSVQHFMLEVKSRYGTHVFNERFLDKNEVFDTLRRDSALIRHLPESYPLTSFDTLRKMCLRFPIVFLKPALGSLGKGIIRVCRRSDGSYETMTTSLDGVHHRLYPNLPKLFAGISGKIRTAKFQIQQGLHLIDHANRPIDFRSLVQKNRQGVWKVTSIVARTAGGNHFVSNLARGGSLSTVQEAMARCHLPLDAKRTASARLQQASLDIANGIDKQIDAHFGELGIDLAMDTSGRVWLLEVNSKPSKNDNTALNAEDQKIRPSVRRLLDYCCHLTGY